MTGFFTLKIFFKLFNIHISGGGVATRFALSTVQSNLLNFLYLSGLYSLFDNKSVYDSFINLNYSKNMRIRSSKSVNRVLAIPGSYIDPVDLYKTADKYYNSLFERVRLFQFIHKQIPALKVKLSKLKDRVDYYSSLHTSYIARFETAKKR